MADSKEEDDVELGFVEKVANPLRLASPFFPSKVGGVPAWLDLENLPSSNGLLCKSCQKPLAFLMQVYSPFSEGVASEERCFHRTVFVFCCRNGKCYKKNSNDCFLVLRCQLPRKNKFYSFNPPPEIDDNENVTLESVSSEFRPRKFACLCDVCGCSGTKKCSKCKSVFYCSRDHQVFGWKTGHKTACNQLAEGKTIPKEGNTPLKPNQVLFPELEIITETEPPEEQFVEKSEEEKMKEFESMSKSLGVDSSKDQELERLAELGKEKFVVDKIFKNFKKRVLRCPDQVLRYQRGGEPLWVSDEYQPRLEDVPKCQCGSSRQFEFQIMPQLLNYLKVDSVEASMDWGTIVIFTCSTSCDEGHPYHQEFAWKQDFTDTGLPGNALIQ
ncbi:programmed cell death protein 2 [Nematostella vectensis]|uniref:programmed cell death protein 2 n=1 Tax=Nematostella vectensis TaxID=45351 RepID=UPI002077183F|nr:programmed cell death protein 2 [Nematostella vectensis]